MDIRKITDIPTEDLRGKRVLLRADFNVPLGSNNIVDHEEAWRIDKGMKTINYLREHGARVIVISHLGRTGESLRPIAEYINQNYNTDLGFVPQITGDLIHDVSLELPQGGVILLENLRQHPGEKENDESFAEELSTYADIYINDAFAVSHRNHASVVRLPKMLPSYAGFQFLDEYKFLSEAANPECPAMLVLGGAKFGTKLDLLSKFVKKVDYAFVGGALSNNFFKAKGYPVGSSLIDDSADISSLLNNEKIILPIDVAVQSKDGEVRYVDPAIGDISETDTIVDCGPETIEFLKQKMSEMKSVVWNGPLGNYEIGFAGGTSELAKILAGVDADIYAGGGDTVAVLAVENITDSYKFVSTAGGAMLDYLVSGTLPGIEVLS